MSVDIVRAAFAANDTAFELMSYPYTRCLELARSGGLAGCFNTSPDAQIRAQFLLPQEMLFSEDLVLWGRAGEVPITDLATLNGKRVAITIGYTYGEVFDSYRDIQRIPVRRDLNGFRMLKHGRVDYTLAFRGTALNLMQEHPELAGQFSALKTVHRLELYLTFSRHHPQALKLLQQFDDGIRRIRQDGTYQQIIEHWQYSRGQTPTAPSTLQETSNNNAELP